MPRVWIVLIVVAIAFWVYTIVDAILTDRSRVRGYPKQFWVVLTVIVPVIGGVLWLVVGKARRTGPGARPIAPDDDPAFLRTLSSEEIAKRAEQDERLRQLEQELADLDDDTPADPER